MYVTLYTPLFFLLLIFSSCTQNEINQSTANSTSKKNNETAMPLETKESIPEEFKYLLGSWHGTLREKPIIIEIEKINKNEITGYNIVGKNKRPITGLITNINYKLDNVMECQGCISSHKLILKEPGDDKWDGFFTLFTYNWPGENNSNSEGKWESYNGSLKGNVDLSK